MKINYLPNISRASEIKYEPEAHSELRQTSKMELSVEKLFHRKLHLRYLTRSICTMLSYGKHFCGREIYVQNQQ